MVALNDARVILPNPGILEANVPLDPSRVSKAEAQTTAITERHAIDDRNRLDHILEERAST